jgi:hypothetical protein
MLDNYQARVLRDSGFEIEDLVRLRPMGYAATSELRLKNDTRQSASPEASKLRRIKGGQA